MRTFGNGRPIIFLLLTLGLFALLGATECSKVSDDVTGPTGSLVGSGGGGDEDCLDDCERDAKDERKDESRRWKRNIRDCKKEDDRRDSQEAVVACLQAEAQRHLDEMQAIADRWVECIIACGGLSSFDDCAEFCEEEGERQAKDENKIHKEIKKACRRGNGDDGDDDDDDDDDAAHQGGSDGTVTARGGDPCRDEDARHEAALEQIQRWVDECTIRCHNQGGGSGGQ